MPRTNQNAVKNLLRHNSDNPDYDGTTDLGQFIDTANVIVTRVNSCASDKDITLSSTELELIERWLAAHFYVMSDQVRESKRTGDAEAKYQGKTGKNLESSKYGQTALTLDWSGCLAGLSSRNVAGLFWAGKTPTEALDYDERD